MEKKLTIRLDTGYEYHRLVLEKISARDRNRYKTLADYICEAVAAFEEPEEKPGRVLLTEEDRHLLCREIVAAMRQETLGTADGEQESTAQQKPGY